MNFLKQLLCKIQSKRLEKYLGLSLVLKEAKKIPEPKKNREKVLKAGVVGVGYLGQHHARLYGLLDNVQLVGVYDTDMIRSQEIASLNACQAFKSLEQLASSCDIASVVVPTDKHCHVALELIAQKTHLLIEKPLCTDLGEAERILQAAKDNDCIVQVGHVENYNPVMRYLEQNVKNPAYITADRLAPFNERGTEVGVVLDLMIHDIGIILNLVKSEVQSVEAVGVSVLSKVEDIANARITFKNGCIANLNASRVSFKKVREIRIFQPFEYISLNFMQQKGHILRKKANILEKEEVPIEKGEPLKLELESFVECVRSAKLPKVGGEFAKNALGLAIQITELIHNQNKKISHFNAN